MFLSTNSKMPGILSDPTKVEAGRMWWVNALTGACAAGDMMFVEELLNKGANVNAVSEDNQTTPLIAASRRGHSEVVEFLCKKKAVVNARDSRSMTALEYAVLRPYPDVVAVLRRYYRADVNLTSFSGLILPHYANCNGDNKMVEMLTDSGISVEKERKTAKCLEKPKWLRHTKIAGVLKGKGKKNPKYVHNEVPKHSDYEQIGSRISTYEYRDFGPIYQQVDEVRKPSKCHSLTASSPRKNYPTYWEPAVDYENIPTGNSGGHFKAEYNQYCLPSGDSQSPGIWVRNTGYEKNLYSLPGSSEQEISSKAKDDHTYVNTHEKLFEPRSSNGKDVEQTPVAHTSALYAGLNVKPMSTAVGNAYLGDRGPRFGLQSGSGTMIQEKNPQPHEYVKQAHHYGQRFVTSHRQTQTEVDQSLDNTRDQPLSPNKMANVTYNNYYTTVHKNYYLGCKGNIGHNKDTESTLYERTDNVCQKGHMHIHTDRGEGGDSSVSQSDVSSSFCLGGQ